VYRLSEEEHGSKWWFACVACAHECFLSLRSAGGHDKRLDLEDKISGVASVTELASQEHDVMFNCNCAATNLCRLPLSAGIEIDMMLRMNWVS
jgi:hypothetical protein